MLVFLFGMHVFLMQFAAKCSVFNDSFVTKMKMKMKMTVPVQLVQN